MLVVFYFISFILYHFILRDEATLVDQKIEFLLKYIEHFEEGIFQNSKVRGKYSNVQCRRKTIKQCCSKCVWKPKNIQIFQNVEFCICKRTMYFPLNFFLCLLQFSRQSTTKGSLSFYQGVVAPLQNKIRQKTTIYQAWLTLLTQQSFVIFWISGFDNFPC